MFLIHLLTFILLFVLSLIFWIISIIFNDIEDGLQFYYKDSIFDWLPKNGWWSWYMVNPDYSWKRKYNEDGTRRKWLGLIPKPVFALDGWHGSKIIRQFFTYLTCFMMFFSGYVLYLLVGVLIFKIIVLIFFVGLVIFGISNLLVHEIYFFKGMIKKDWWISRGKEEKIKEFLDKHF